MVATQRYVARRLQGARACWFCVLTYRPVQSCTIVSGAQCPPERLSQLAARLGPALSAGLSLSRCVICSTAACRCSAHVARVARVAHARTIASPLFRSLSRGHGERPQTAGCLSCALFGGRARRCRLQAGRLAGGVDVDRKAEAPGRRRGDGCAGRWGSDEAARHDARALAARAREMCGSTLHLN